MIELDLDEVKALACIVGFELASIHVLEYLSPVPLCTPVSNQAQLTAI